MKIDARDMECPKPVIMTKEGVEALGEEGVFEILLNSEISKENVCRFLRQSGLEPDIKNTDNGEYIITAVKGYKCEIKPAQNTGRKVVFVKSDHIGDNEELGAKLIRGFLTAMLSATQKPQKIIFVNSGVFLTAKAECVDAAETLKKLENEGVEIYSCGACLEFYGHQGSLMVGNVGNALDTVEALLGGEGVVCL